MSRRALGLAVRRARRRALAQVALVAALGVYCAIAGPWQLAPVCWAAATVMYWRRGVTILKSLRDVPAAKPFTDILYPPREEVATATARLRGTEIKETESVE